MPGYFSLLKQQILYTKFCGKPVSNRENTCQQILVTGEKYVKVGRVSIMSFNCLQDLKVLPVSLLFGALERLNYEFC